MIYILQIPFIFRFATADKHVRPTRRSSEENILVAIWYGTEVQSSWHARSQPCA